MKLREMLRMFGYEETGEKWHDRKVYRPREHGTLPVIYGPLPYGDHNSLAFLDDRNYLREVGVWVFINQMRAKFPDVAVEFDRRLQEYRERRASRRARRRAERLSRC